jgi:hypothetical protein
MAETLDVLKKLGKSVARGVPQLATGFVDLAALPLTMTGVRKPEQIFGSTAYLTDKGLLPQPQTGLLNEGAELASSMVNPAGLAKLGLIGALAPAKYIGRTLQGMPDVVDVEERPKNIGPNRGGKQGSTEESFPGFFGR